MKRDLTTASPARLYCALVGAALVIAGILGFFYSSSFETGASTVAANSDAVLGILEVNGWHNLVHIALGLLALVAAGSATAARTYCLAIGLLYLVLALWGFIDSDGVLVGLVPVNDEDNVLHLILGLTGLGAGAATEAGPKRAKAPRTKPSRAKAPAESKPGEKKPATGVKPRSTPSKD